MSAWPRWAMQISSSSSARTRGRSACSRPSEGTVLVKFWLHVSEDEQLRRFRARERDPLKRWKLTREDWRNLSHRADYERAIEEMLAETDHAAAPWDVIAAESKPYARAMVL